MTILNIQARGVKPNVIVTSQAIRFDLELMDIMDIDANQVMVQAVERCQHDMIVLCAMPLHYVEWTVSTT